MAYGQPIARSGIELIRGTASDPAIATLLERELIAHNPHQLHVTTPPFLEHAGLRDPVDLPTLDRSADEEAETAATLRATPGRMISGDTGGD